MDYADADLAVLVLLEREKIGQELLVPLLDKQHWNFRSWFH
ncbi:hypothetical protein [Paenibacillus senegalensis]|nr:hypothetical protein [Paenibacillus senegalensis]